MWEIEINNWVHYILIIMVDLSMYQVADAKGGGRGATMVALLNLSDSCKYGASKVSFFR